LNRYSLAKQKVIERSAASVNTPTLASADSPTDRDKIESGNSAIAPPHKTELLLDDPVPEAVINVR
jgi:hypothetical protein